jgi:golgi apparatus protein 1
MKRYVFTLIFAALAALSTVVLANERQAMQACRTDVQKFCSKVERGEGRIAKCLKENEEKISNACKTQLKLMTDKAKPAPESPVTRTEADKPLN